MFFLKQNAGKMSEIHWEANQKRQTRRRRSEFQCAEVFGHPPESEVCRMTIEEVNEDARQLLFSHIVALGVAV